MDWAAMSKAMMLFRPAVRSWPAQAASRKFLFG